MVRVSWFMKSNRGRKAYRTQMPHEQYRSADHLHFIRRRRNFSRVLRVSSYFFVPVCFATSAVNDGANFHGERSTPFGPLAQFCRRRKAVVTKRHAPSTVGVDVRLRTNAAPPGSGAFEANLYPCTPYTTSGMCNFNVASNE